MRKDRSAPFLAGFFFCPGFGGGGSQAGGRQAEHAVSELQGRGDRCQGDQSIGGITDERAEVDEEKTEQQDGMKVGEERCGGGG